LLNIIETKTKKSLPNLSACEVTSGPSHGEISVTGNTPRSVATFTCDDGYTLVGMDILTCQNNNVWSGEFPVCF